MDANHFSVASIVKGKEKKKKRKLSYSLSVRPAYAIILKLKSHFIVAHYQFTQCAVIFTYATTFVFSSATV